MSPVATKSAPPPERLWTLVCVAVALAVLVAVLIWRGDEEVSGEVPGAAASAAARTSVAKLISFDDGELEKELDQEKDLLTDDYREAYRAKFVDLTGAAALEAGTTVTAKVESIGVVEQDGKTVQLLAYVSVRISLPDGTVTSPGGRPVSVEMQDVGGSWLVSDVELP